MKNFLIQAITKHQYAKLFAIYGVQSTNFALANNTASYKDSLCCMFMLLQEFDGAENEK